MSGGLLIDGVQLRRGVTVRLARRVLLQLHCADPAAPRVAVPGLVGESTAMRRIRGLMERVGSRDTAVLLTGESGTGKELVAQAIHGFGPRRAFPLVAVNMAALPVELANAELFGVRRGAYTGADADREGYLQRAHRGTLFLDEIGECPRQVQPQLLRALEKGEVQPAGGGIEHVDVRFIAATDAPIADVGSGFSNALRHRLGGFEIHLPPLRGRIEDMGRLLALGLDEPLSRLAATKEAVAGWSALFESCAHYGWPGNVRELFNACQQVSVTTGDADRPIVPEPLLSRLRPQAAQRRSHRRASSLSESEVRSALSQAAWEVSRAASALAVSRQALYNRIQSIPGLRVAADVPAAEVEAVYHECNGALGEAATRLQVSAAGLRRRWRAMELPPTDC